MLSELLVAAIVAASFGIGVLLYYATAEEVEAFKKSFSRYKALSKAKDIALAPIGLLGVAYALTTKSAHFKSASLVLLALGLAFGSFVIAGHSKELTLKYTAETVLTFLAFFLTVYFMIFALS